MRGKTLIINLIIIVLVMTGSQVLRGQTPENHMHISLTHDIAGNAYGGIKPGLANLGLINLDFALQSKRLGFWNNGTFRVHMQNTYGQKPTENLVGDMQVFSNIENGYYTYLYQFWYKHRIGDLSLLIGKHDLNEIFFAGDQPGEYINSSFGIMPVASLNIPVSIFPATTLGFVGSYEFNHRSSVHVGIYNGVPGEITPSNFGTDLNLNASNGLVYVGEWHFQGLVPGLDGSYKVGAFYHSGQSNPATNPAYEQNGANGIYLIADQNVYENQGPKNQSMGTFFQVGYSPGQSSINDLYLATGINYAGLFSSAGKDMAGVSVAYASCNHTLLESEQETFASCETVLEWFYKYQVTDKLIVQPDIQYIIHPGMNTDHDNSWVGIFRLKWTMDKTLNNGTSND